MLMRVGKLEDGVFSSDYGVFDPGQQAYASFGFEQFWGVTPDGRYLIGLPAGINESEQEEATLVAIDLESGEQVWETQVPPTVYTLEASGENFYFVARETVDGTEVPVLTELDLETGQETRRWPDLIPSLQSVVTGDVRIRLYVGPDNTRLFVMLDELGNGPTNVSSLTLASYSLPDMTFESSNIQTDSTANRPFPVDFDFYEAAVTPDSQYIYRVDDEGFIQFRSAMANEDRDLSLPFTQKRPDNENLVWLTSNDGRYLYVMTVERRQVAIVDLLTRRVASSFPLAFADEPASLQENFTHQIGNIVGTGGESALSHDGSHLYLTGSMEEDVSSGVVAQSVIWTIDLSTWTVTAGWNVPGTAILGSERDGNLTVTSLQQDVTDGQSTKLITIDTETGQVVDEFDGEGLPENANDFFATPLSQIYQQRYGRTPAVDHVAAADIEAESTLPRITAFASSDTPAAGSTIQFAVRALNPVDGQLQVEQSPDVRFDLDSTVVLRLIHEEGAAADVILIPNAIEQSLYRASTTILETGVWDAEVTITSPDGDSWTMRFDDMFEIGPSWEASDGRRYVLRVQTDPSEPPRGEEVTVTAHFVEVDTGRPMPNGVQLLETLPNEVRVAFDAEEGGRRAATLTRNDEGIYEGVISFPNVDAWEATVIVRDESGDTVQVQAGVTNVVRESE
ncbi:MAG: hypothetical protein R3A46_13950 [Thermomicrobiales bacterium]